MIFPFHLRRALLIAFTAIVVSQAAPALEHITLRNGFELDCTRRESVGDRVKLYLAGNGLSGKSANTNFLEVAADAIAASEVVTDSPVAAPGQTHPSTPDGTAIPELLARSGRQHHIDAEMLASVVNAESGGHARAVSRTGARGLMQLMPGTARQLGVNDAFQPDQNIAGGSAYLDQLLTRYHDNIALALAAYNAGPGAVDRWHGIPPYRETQLYVARVINEFNRRKTHALTQVP